MNLGSYIVEWQCLLHRPTIDVKISLRDDVYTGGGPGAIIVKHQEDLRMQEGSSTQSTISSKFFSWQIRISSDAPEFLFRDLFESVTIL